MDLILFLMVIFLCFAWAWQSIRTRKEKIHNQQLIEQSEFLTSRLQKAEHSSESKSRYLSGISHELRTPLNVIMGYAQILELEENDPNHQQFRLIRQNCEHLNHLIESLLEFSAMEAGKLKVQNELTNLPELINQLQMMFQNMANAKNLDFQCHFPEHLPKWVKTDRQRLRQILINLLSNAIKFTNQGQVSLQVTYRSQVAKFTVSDSGDGIKTNDIDKIFTPFERLDHHNLSTAGTGLGLPISRLLAELMGGELSVKSEWEQGSQFTLKLMLSEQAAPKEKQSEEFRQLNTESLQVLVIDDEEAHLDLMKKLLKNCNHLAYTEQNSQLVLERLKNQSFDLLILDINMPNVDGWDLAEQIRNAGYGIPIVMLSGNAKDQVSSKKTHHQAYLTKPIQLTQLKQCLSQVTHIHSKEPQEQHFLSSAEPISLSHSQQATLQSMADIGHINGILDQLEKWQQQQHIGSHSYQSLKSAANSYQIQHVKDLLHHAQN